MNKELDFLIYKTSDDSISVNAVIKDETIWLSQKAMSELFDVGVPAISKHLKNIFEEGELVEKVVISKMEIATAHGAIPDKTQASSTNFYNLDAIISVVRWDLEAPEKNPYTIDGINEIALKTFIDRANLVGRIDFPYTNKVEILKKTKIDIWWRFDECC